MLKHFALISTIVLSAGFASPTKAEDPTGKTVVATVGGTDITVGHMIAMAHALPKDQLQLTIDELFSQVLERLIQQEAMVQAIESVPEVILLQAENEKRGLLASHAIEALSKTITIPEGEIQAAYDRRFANFTPQREYNSSHILVDTLAEAQAVLADLENGMAFSDLAILKSKGPSGPSGGALGWYVLERMVPAYADAIRQMEPGETSEPVQSDFGWHVITLHETRIPSIPSLEEIRNSLEQEVWNNRFDQAFIDIVQGTEIQRSDISGINPDILLNVDLLDH